MVEYFNIEPYINIQELLTYLDENSYFNTLIICYLVNIDTVDKMDNSCLLLLIIIYLKMYDRYVSQNISTFILTDVFNEFIMNNIIPSLLNDFIDLLEYYIHPQVYIYSGEVDIHHIMSSINETIIFRLHHCSLKIRVDAYISARSYIYRKDYDYAFGATISFFDDYYEKQMINQLINAYAKVDNNRIMVNAKSSLDVYVEESQYHPVPVPERVAAYAPPVIVVPVTQTLTDEEYAVKSVALYTSIQNEISQQMHDHFMALDYISKQAMTPQITDDMKHTNLGNAYSYAIRMTQDEEFKINERQKERQAVFQLATAPPHVAELIQLPTDLDAQERIQSAAAAIATAIDFQLGELNDMLNNILHGINFLEYAARCNENNITFLINFFSGSRQDLHYIDMVDNIRRTIQYIKGEQVNYSIILKTPEEAAQEANYIIQEAHRLNRNQAELRNYITNIFTKEETRVHDELQLELNMKKMYFTISSYVLHMETFRLNSFITQYEERFASLVPDSLTPSLRARRATGKYRITSETIKEFLGDTNAMMDAYRRERKKLNKINRDEKKGDKITNTRARGGKTMHNKTHRKKYSHHKRHNKTQRHKKRGTHKRNHKKRGTHKKRQS